MALQDFFTKLLKLVKEWAQEDPDGPATGYYRDMNRAWRKGTGRSRGRR